MLKSTQQRSYTLDTCAGREGGRTERKDKGGPRNKKERIGGPRNEKGGKIQEAP